MDNIAFFNIHLDTINVRAYIYAAKARSKHFLKKSNRRGILTGTRDTTGRGYGRDARCNNDGKTDEKRRNDRRKKRGIIVKWTPKVGQKFS